MTVTEFPTVQVLSKILNKEAFLDFIPTCNLSAMGLFHLSFHDKVHFAYIPKWPYKKHPGARYPHYFVLYFFLTLQKFPHDIYMDYHTD